MANEKQCLFNYFWCYSQISFIHFSELHKKKHRTQENVPPYSRFFNLKKAKLNTHSPNAVIFRCFGRCSHTPHCPANRSTLVACPTWLALLLGPWKHWRAQFHVLCFLGFSCFSLRAPSSFAMSAHVRLGSQITAAKSQVSRLLMVGFASFQSWMLAMRNGKPARAPKMSSTMQMVPSRRKDQR